MESVILPKRGMTLTLLGFGRKYILHAEDSQDLTKYVQGDVHMEILTTHILLH